MQGQADRVNYLMTKQAKIVAMTCTHAALKRREFLELGFKFDNLLMEESAQILEIETFIPMLLQVAMLAIAINMCCKSGSACNALLVWSPADWMAVPWGTSTPGVNFLNNWERFESAL